MRFAASEPITNFLQRKENYENLAGQAALERAQENAAILEAEGLVTGAGLLGQANVKSAKYTGQADAYAGRAAGNAAMIGGAMESLGSIGSAGIAKYRQNQKMNE